MMKKILVALLALSLTTAAAAATALSVKVGHGLTILGSAPGDCYLGLSLYPPGASGSTREGMHTVRQVQRGTLELFVDLPAKFRGGTYEVALWRRQVGLSQCTTAGCRWCARNGFHMEGLLGYRSGSIPQR